MTVPRAVKLERRRAITRVPEVEYGWIVCTLLPSMLVGLLVWAAMINGAR